VKLKERKNTQKIGKDKEGLSSSKKRKQYFQ
jgi:hypothetical protein